MTELQLELLDVRTNMEPGRVAPLLHKWFARRRPEAIKFILDQLEKFVSQQKLHIYDPFMGSGMILLESALRGHYVSGTDINPVAWLIARQTLNPVSVEELMCGFSQIQSQIGERISSLYRTVNADGLSADTVTAFHVRTVTDPFGHELELHHNYLLARNKRADWAFYYCPRCHSVFQGEVASRVRCSFCNIDLEWAQGTVSKGVVHCETCNKWYRLRDLYKEQTNSPKFKLIAIESFSSISGRQYHAPSDIDHNNISQAAVNCTQNPVALSMLRRLVPAKRRDPRPLSHGFKYYGELFTSRQLWSLGLLAQTISEIEPENTRFALALSLSDAAGCNSLMCRYAADWLKLTPAFGLHGFDTVGRPVEGNVWGAPRGRGSFINCIRKAARAYSAIGTALNRTTRTSSFDEVVCIPAQLILNKGKAEFDAIITDPPYFDNLDYAELADFYYQWLRIALREIPPFDREYCFNDKDLAVIASTNGEPTSFSRELSLCFESSLRGLKENGVFAFSYHHSNIEAWLALRNALIDSRLATFTLRFVRSELDNGFHSAAGNIKVDAIFFCRRSHFIKNDITKQMLGQAVEDLKAQKNLKAVDLNSAKLAIATALSTLEISRPLTDFVDVVSRYINIHFH